MPNQVAYGFMNLKDRFDELVDNVGIRVVSDAIALTAAEYNRQFDAMLRFFVRPTTDIQIRYKVAGVNRLQPLDENGRARPIKQAGHYDVAFPLYTAGTAWGATWLERQKMTVEDANNATNQLFLGDRIWMRDHVLSALFQNASWNYDDEDKGTLTIQSLANGDTVVYPYWSGGAFGATDNHYMAQANPIADADNPFPTIYTELTEHQENTGDVVSFVASNLVADIQGLTTFEDLPDPNIVNPLGTRLVGSPALNEAPGILRGYVTSAKAFVVEWNAIPDDYMVSIMTGGERPLAMREDPLASLRGFRQIATREDHPFWESQWFRRAGFGGWNRVGAVVTRIGNGTYAPPTNYALPAL